MPLKPYEFISIALKIEKRSVVVIKEIITKTPRLKTTNQIITKYDWEKIFLLPFSEKQIAILNLFKKNDNKPLLAEEIERFHANFSSSQIGILNSVFIRSKANYRLRSIDYGLNWNRERFKLVIVE